MEERRQKAAMAGDRNKFSTDMDRISLLPDELLGFMLSLLTLKEASVTSILSRRWKSLWTFTPTLDFDGVDSLLKLPSRRKPGYLSSYIKTLDEQRSKFVRWVNNALALRNVYSTIEDFKIHFNLGENHRNFIDEWIGYALAREVQTLKLNLTRKSNWGCRSDTDCYVFPTRFLHNTIHFKQLKLLSLHFVNVSGEALEFFLHNCPLLECLSVSHSRGLSSEMRIVGPFPSLKRLKIGWCENLMVVEIRDVNLVYFKYGGAEIIKFLHHNVPTLVHISVEAAASSSTEAALGQFHGILPQLEIFDIWIQQQSIVVSDLVKLSNLKKLMVTYSLRSVESLLSLTNLIRAAPCLEKFVFKSRLYEKFYEGEIEKRGNVYSHLNLKEVEFFGYRGTANEVELIVHILENAVALQSIMIDSRIYFHESPCSQKWYDASKSILEDVNARVRVKNQLAKIVPPQIKLEIL